MAIALWKFLDYLDTGASLNVMPYALGLELGAVWEDQKLSQFPYQVILRQWKQRG
nr:hypothetical protein [Pseudanabaena cinerea]